VQRCHPSLCLADGYNNGMPEGKDLCITSFLNSRCNIKMPYIRSDGRSNSGYTDKIEWIPESL